MIRHPLRTYAAGLVLAVLVALAPRPVAAGVIIVANPSVEADSIGIDTLKDYYLGNTTSWADGKSIRTALPAAGPVLTEFLKTCVKKTPSHFGLLWKKAVFTGTGTPPAEFATDADLLEFVANTPGAIGFVAAGTPVRGVKILPVK
jgi:ABC-type phosphate transport system substrate-binding protein